jgi:predicted Zn-dependent protease
MQNRLNTIGQKLIPAYQLHLAAADPSKINFRFQLTDGKRWPAILTLPSGIILVPHEVVERMENDSQLAEILADAIACVLEKQTYRLRIASGVISAGSVASWAQFLSVVPVVGLAGTAAGIGSGTGQFVLIRKEERQSGRVSLGLLHDAGYDVSQAPVLVAAQFPQAPPRFLHRDARPLRLPLPHPRRSLAQPAAGRPSRRTMSSTNPARSFP